MAEKAREEVLQRQRAVMNHRHFFLNEDDASQIEEPEPSAARPPSGIHKGLGEGGRDSPSTGYEVEEGEVLPEAAAAGVQGMGSVNGRREGKSGHVAAGAGCAGRTQQLGPVSRPSPEGGASLQV